jgi:hypothetical protein
VFAVNCCPHPITCPTSVNSSTFKYDLCRGKKPLAVRLFVLSFRLLLIICTYCLSSGIFSSSRPVHTAFPHSTFLVSQQLNQLSAELRAEVIHTVSKTGGHLGSSLGVVELTVALHHVFDCPEDKILWDVGHQVRLRFPLSFISPCYYYSPLLFTIPPCYYYPHQTFGLRTFLLQQA